MSCDQQHGQGGEWDIALAQILDPTFTTPVRSEMSFLDTPNVAAITSIAITLHLFNHRNKNQHRRSIWWRHFSVFRRQIGLLERDLLTLTATPSTNLERVRLKASSPAIRTRIQQRLDTWPIATWQHAFSQLIADGRFGQFGVLLLASLAEVCAVTQMTDQLEALGELEIQKVLNDFSREWSEDVGQAIERPITPPKKQQRRQVRANVIDDLFGGL